MQPDKANPEPVTGPATSPDPDQGNAMPTPAAANAGPNAQPAGAAARFDDPMFETNLQPWERTYTTFLHLTALTGLLFGLPVIGALIMWAIKKDSSVYVADHGKEAMNFQLSLVIYFVVGIALTASGIGACVGMPLIGGVYILGIVGMILAAVAANQGRYYRYPMCLRMIA
jgi:uncharacterized protein